MLKLYTRFHVQERFSWSSFVICILKSRFRYVNTNIQFFSSFSLWQTIFLYSLLDISCIWIHSIFLIWLVPRTTWKGLFYSFKFNLKNRGVLIFTHYQYFWVLSWKYGLVIFRWYLPQLFVAAFSRGDLSQLFAVRICRGYFPWEFAAAICRGFLPWKFAAAICRENLPQLFAVTIFREYLPWLFAAELFCVSKKMFFLCEWVFFLCKQTFLNWKQTFFIWEKNFLSFMRISFLTVFLYVFFRGRYGPP